jgi:hypothetical protein
LHSQQREARGTDPVRGHSASKKKSDHNDDNDSDIQAAAAAAVRLEEALLLHSSLIYDFPDIVDAEK